MESINVPCHSNGSKDTTEGATKTSTEDIKTENFEKGQNINHITVDAEITQHIESLALGDSNASSVEQTLTPLDKNSFGDCNIEREMLCLEPIIAKNRYTPDSVDTSSVTDSDITEYADTREKAKGMKTGFTSEYNDRYVPLESNMNAQYDPDTETCDPSGFLESTNLDFSWLQSLIQEKSSEYADAIEKYTKKELKDMYSDYNDDDIDDMYCCLQEGGEICANGSREDLVEGRIAKLERLNVTNVKSFLNISMPLHMQTTIGKIFTLNFKQDQDARKMQFDHLKKLFGQDESKIGNQMEFVDKCVTNKKELLSEISTFLQDCNNPESKRACVLAVIILNGHGYSDGSIVLPYEHAPAKTYKLAFLPFKQVVDHIDEQLRLIHKKVEKNTLQLPLSVLVLNGLCHAHGAGAEALNPQNIKINVRYYTSNRYPTTQNKFIGKEGVSLPSRKNKKKLSEMFPGVVSEMFSGVEHDQLAKEADGQRDEDIRGDFMRNTVDKYTTYEDVQEYEKTSENDITKVFHDEEKDEPLKSKQDVIVCNVSNTIDNNEVPNNTQNMSPSQTTTPINSKDESFFNVAMIRAPSHRILSLK